MATSTYTGKLTDFGEAPFPNAEPNLTVRPKRDAFGAVGIMSTRRVPVTVASDGSFSFQLVASAQTTPPQSYILRCDWFGDGASPGYSEWEFTAKLGGGNIKDMGVVDTAGLYAQALGEILPGLIDLDLDVRVPPIVDSKVTARLATLPTELSLVSAIATGNTTRTTRTTMPVTFQDRTRATLYPSVYPAVYPGVTWNEVGRREAQLPVVGADGKLPASVIPDIDLGVLTELKVRAVPSGPSVFEVRSDGSTWIKNAVIENGAGGGGSEVVSRVVVVVAMGQSNAVAYGEPGVSLLDGVSSRIWQLPDGGSALTPATVPLETPDPAESGLAPAHVLAREIAANDPDCQVVIVPAARGGSGLVYDPGPGVGVWAIDYAGSNPKLYTNTVSRMTVAFSAISAKWGVTPTVIGTWLQGEADGNGTTRSQYANALDALISDWYSRYGGVFLIGGICPQTSGVGSGTRPEIVLALQDTPRRAQHSAYVPGVDNGGGARGPADEIHYGREAVEAIGRGWFEAIPRASNNVGGSHTTPPLRVEATRWGNEVTASWSFPYSRVTAFEVQSSPDGSAWSPVAVTEPVATSAVFTSAVPVKVRVRAIGTETSNWTAPVIAVGG